ncbi:hypothetical protein H8959_021224 [Pygathrix nigripes]
MQRVREAETMKSQSGPGVPPNHGEGTLPYSYNLCVASHSAKTEFNFLSLPPEMAPPQDLLCDDPSMIVCANQSYLPIVLGFAFEPVIHETLKGFIKKLLLYERYCSKD